MAINRNKILSMLCAGALGISAFSGMTFQSVAAPKDQIGSEYKLVAENDDYALYLYGDQLSIIVEDKSTGNLLRSTITEEDASKGNNNKTWLGYMNSGIVVTSIKGTTTGNQVDLVNNANTITYTYNDNGFSAAIDYTDQKFGFTVDVSLEDNELVVHIADDSIYENGKDTYIGTIAVFPFFGYSYLDDKEGYMLIPDGNGALMYLDDKEGRYVTGFSKMIYGSDLSFTGSITDNLLMDKYETVNDSEQIIAPIFGLAHTDDQLGYLAVVEDGATRASIDCQPNGAMVAYNRCFATFTERLTYTQPLNNSENGSVVTSLESDRTHSDLQVRYLLISGEDATYAGMANEFREYLLENELVSQQNTSYNTRVDFLGTDREEFLISTRAVTMTTVDDIDSIFKDLQRAGVQNVLSVYKGWQKGGVYNFPTTKYKVDSKIGSNKELGKLMSDAAGSGYYLYLYDDALRINPSEYNATFDVIKQINKRRYEETTYANVYKTFNYLTPARSNEVLTSLIKSASKYDANSIALAGVTNILYSYNYSGVNYSRQSVADAYAKLAESAASSSNLIMEQPLMYLWQYTSAYLDMPLGSSNYMYENEDIPFLSMVLKGIIPMYSRYVNFEANKTEFFLQMIESGVFPSFYVTKEDSADLIYTNSADLYSTQYQVYRDEIIRYNTELQLVAEKVAGANIINHEMMDNGLTVVTYNNGVKIYINYSNQTVKMDGLTIESMSYKVGD